MYWKISKLHIFIVVDPIEVPFILLCVASQELRDNAKISSTIFITEVITNSFLKSKHERFIGIDLLLKVRNAMCII